jgi:hypothetical protein
MNKKKLFRSFVLYAWYGIRRCGFSQSAFNKHGACKPFITNFVLVKEKLRLQLFLKFKND